MINLVQAVFHGIKWRFHRAFDAWQDWRLAIDASGLLQKDELESRGANARHSHVYLGTPHLVLSLAFRRLRIDPNEFTFIDLGSGKGRVVVRAAMRPFKGVVGVELSPRMHRVALENIHLAANAHALCAPATVHNEDVIAYDLPKTPLVFFFFNAFERVVLIEFIEKLKQSLRDHPRECYLIYLNPRNDDCLLAKNLMRKLPSSKLSQLLTRLLSPWPLAIYRTSIPAAD